MALICNVPKVEQELHQSVAGDSRVSGEWWKVYLGNEQYIESGAAYFAQAFAEALGIVTALELHDPRGAELKISSIAYLLERALEQYEAAVEFSARSGLGEFHERRLREAGLDLGGVRQVLTEARNRDLLGMGDERIDMIAATFARVGYPGLMSHYTGKVREIYDLVASMRATGGPGDDAIAWQELGWKLTALFTQALEVGQAIAVLNCLTSRLQRSLGPLPSSLVASDAVRSS